MHLDCQYGIGPKNHVWRGFWILIPYWQSEWGLLDIGCPRQEIMASQDAPWSKLLIRSLVVLCIIWTLQEPYILVLDILARIFRSFDHVAQTFLVQACAPTARLRVLKDGPTVGGDLKPTKTNIEHESAETKVRGHNAA